jgi:outer membrane protein insertion porin family
VVEKNTGSVTVGVGYSTQSQLVGRAGLSDSNFRGLDETARLSWEVGDVNSTSSVDVGFTEPYLDRHHTALDVDVYDKAVYRFSSNTFGATSSGSSNTYTEQHVGGSIAVRRPVGDTLSAAISLRSETVRTNNVTLPQDVSFIRQNGNITGLGGNFSSDTRDNYLSPAGGGLATIGEEIATANTTTANNGPTPLGPGQHTFLKSSLDFRRYISLQGPRKGNIDSPKKVFAVHFLFGTTAKEIPFSEQYFIGGPDDLRGYNVERYWGNNLALGQAELRLPLGKSDSYQVVLLSDVGDAWGSIYTGGGFTQHEKFTPLADYGIGVRLKTPVGPIRLDYAIGSNGGQTQFSIGPSF